MVTIQLEDDEALVLFEFLARHENLDLQQPISALRSEDRSEILALWSVVRCLERNLGEPFHKDYQALVDAARASVRTRWGTEWTIADKVWNRSAMQAGGEAPRPGDRALAALLLVHGLIMNGGVHHAVEGLTPAEFVAAVDGYSYFGYGDVAALLNSVHQVGALSQVTDEQEAETDARYAQLIPDDAHLAARFETIFRQRPDQFAPVV